MKKVHENGFVAMQNTSVIGLACIMVMASFAGNFGNTPSGNSGQLLSSSSSYSAFPDDDPDSGKFLGVAGSGTLTNIPIICHIGVPAGETSFDLDIFDGDIGGHWDQHYDDLDFMDFTLYEDPYKDGTGTTIVTSWTHTNMVDDSWYLGTFSTTSGAQAPSGNYFYRLEIKWRNPGTSFSNNYFKIRTTGQISMAKGDKFAIMGAPLRVPFGNYNQTPPWEIYNLDPPVWAGDPDPSINNIDANSYDGDWNFNFYIPKTRPSIIFKDGDADIVVDDDDANTPPPENASNGAPQDGPSPYDGCNVAPNIKYTITDPDGNTYQNLNPSGNMEWENFIISKNSSDNPDYLVNYDLSAGLWNMHFEGMDAHNMNFIEASFEIFTTTDPPLPVNPPPTLVPSWSSTVSPGTNVNYAHTLTNNGASDVFDLTATSSHGWTTKIYHDSDGDGVLDSSEISAGEISDTGTLATNASYDMIVQVVVPSSSGSTTDYTTVTGSSQTEWNIQASVTDTTNVMGNNPPVADPNGPYTVNEGDTLQLDGSGSYDPDGDSLTYYWDLDDDNYYDDSTSVNPTYSWSEDGNYNVKLAVTDGQYWDFESTTVKVYNVPPEIYSTSYVFTLTQGSDSWTIPAVESTLTPAQFYNYYSASAHTGFEIPYQSFVYLYRDIDDPSNDVSLFIVHDIDGDIGPPYGSPNAQSRMDLSGIPSGAYLAQSDDPNEFKVHYPSSGQAQGRWHWWYNTDGGAIGGLTTSSSWAITIDPLLWNDVNTWAYYYAGGSNINLDLNEPITISYSSQVEPTTVETDEGTPITLGAFARDWGSDDNPLDYKFEWNDPYNPGATSSGTTPWDTLFTATHTYYEDGTYYPVLTVTDSDLATDTLTFTLIVKNVAPDVYNGADNTIDEGTLVTLIDSFSDPGAYDTHSGIWDWGDGFSSSGTVSEENVPPDSTGTVTGSHIYSDDGTYNVVLTVQDDEGAIDVISSNVMVNNVIPTIDPLSAYSTDENSPVTLSAHAKDPGSDDLTFIWNWGDGTTDTITIYYNDGVGPEPIYDPNTNEIKSPGGTYLFSITDIVSHTYGDNGIYTVTLMVKDDDGGVMVVTTFVTVNNVAPSIDPLGTYTTDENSPITLDAHVTDPGSDDLTFTWEFEFGPTITNTYYNDGVVPEPIYNPSTNEIKSPWGAYPFSGTDVVQHTYGDNGVFKVILTVEDDDGGVTITTLNVTVNNVAPTVDSDGPYIVDENSPISLNGYGTDPGSDDLTFTWEFELGPTMTSVHYNDGVGPEPIYDPNTNEIKSPGGTYPFSATDTVQHTYGDNGNYTITLTVEDDDGGTTIITTYITVSNVAPTIASIEAYMYVNFSLRIAGEKWHSVGIYLYEDGSEIWSAKVTRQPGNPDEQTATITNVKMDMTRSYTALVDYLPNDPRVNGNVWGGTPVWIDMTFEDGSIERLHHTFNVRQSDWDSDHWNHIDPWEVEFASYFGGHDITFEATASDPGSDDLIFDWDFGNGNSLGPNTHYNNGLNPDLPKSPEINPMTATDTVIHQYPSSGTYTITLTVTDDDGGTSTITLILTLLVG
ncbi:MAG: PKD domain-containing protein [Thermoplasmata archaeon]